MNDKDDSYDDLEAREQDAASAGKRKWYKPGCGTVFVLIGAVLLGAGAHLMSRWDAMGGLGKTGAIALVVAGTIILLPFVLYLGLRIVLAVFMRKVAKGLATAGDEIVATNEALYEKVHEFRPANEDDFEETNRAAYDQAQRQFESLGFRYLGDVIDATVERISGISPVIRVMASTDGTTTAGVYLFDAPHTPWGEGGKSLNIVDLATEFSDGTFLATSNTKGLDTTTAATGIDRRQHSLDTSIEDLVQAHETEKQKLLAAKSELGITCVVINTLSDALESEKRQQAVKNAFRKQIGYVDPEEVRRIARQMPEMGESIPDMAADAADKARKDRRTNTNE